jgi:hypothetical protein
MDTTTTLDPQGPALFAGDAARPLPGLVMGDAAAVATSRTHEWPGRLFVGLSYVTSVGCVIAVVTLSCFAAFGFERVGEFWRPIAAAAVWGVLQWRLAREVSRFSRWGWIGAMAELGGAALAKVALAVTMPITIPSALVALVVNGAWMRYFWRRRRDFDVDLGG